ncbi:class I SAM-dependent methyltransferase [Candidatus Woesearchaeota archaeon]|nr:class I SAM-dependent methyltransferase [Nanoarchaeota archaeon]MCB9371100.1 class I SAM-dependent methyltransferase [Candidatus Woesearchaeota archaeon]USN44183.1 MAG: class I SAM-dependent methyltransferase [Candidatus Woesearchaeota archaeon]
MTQVEAEKHYTLQTYDTAQRFASYHKQLELLFRIYKPADKVLEIGAGSQVFASYLKEKKVDIKTADFDENVHPDILADIRKLPCSDEEFDIVCAFQILEHLPYEESLKALQELHRVTKKYLLLSVPYSCIYFGVNFYVGLPFFDKTPNLQLRLPNFWLKANSGNKQHYWELGRKNFPKRRILKDLKKIGFEIEKKGSIFFNKKHYFITCRKK